MDKPLVSIIIVNWNGEHLLLDCLESLAKINYKKTEMIFVDNASTDGSISYVKNNFPEIKIIQNATNLGYAQGHEDALRKAKGEFILLLSTDTIVPKNIIDELLKGINSEDKVGAIMPKLLMYPQKDLIDSIGAFFTWSGLLYHFGREKNAALPKYNKVMEIFSAKGACLLFKKEVLEKTGLFDKDYFAYFEETDLCHRVWLAGYKVIYWPYASVFHKGGGASKKMVKTFIHFHAFKNRICTYLKNLSLINLLRLLPALLLFYEGASMVYLLMGKFGMAWAVQRSIIWNILHIAETLEKRFYVQHKIRVVEDKDFLPKITKSVKPSYYLYIFKGLRYYKD